MSIIKAYSLPHPPLAVPRIGRGEERKIRRALSAHEEVSSEIEELAPETVSEPEEQQITIARQKGGIPERAPLTLERFEVARHE